MGVAEFLALAGIATKLIAFLQKQKETAARTGAWTAEERAKVDATWEQMANSPAWQTKDEEDP